MMQNTQVVRTAPRLSLRQSAPADWHHDRPAFPGDPYMDWENRPEPPREPRWVLAEQADRSKPQSH